jgi:glutathione S-transferase
MPGGKDIKARFDVFNAELPAICARMRLTDDELTFADFYAIAATWLDEHLTTPPPSPVGR